MVRRMRAFALENKIGRRGVSTVASPSMMDQVTVYVLNDFEKPFQTNYSP